MRTRSNEFRIYQTLVFLVNQGPFYRYGFDRGPARDRCAGEDYRDGTLVPPELTLCEPSSVEAGPLESSFSPSQRAMLEYICTRDSYQWGVLVSFSQRVVKDVFEDKLRRTPINLPSNEEHELPQTHILLSSVQYKDPPRVGDVGTTEMLLTFDVRENTRYDDA